MSLRAALITVLLIFAGMVYAGLAFVLAMMPAKQVSRITPADYGLPYERVTLDTADGLALTGWFIPNPASRAVIVVGHGYPFDKGDIFPDTRFLADTFNLLYFDMRYFGESQGKFTTFGLDERRDVDAVMAYLRQRPEIDPGKIGMYGFSLSAATFIQSHHPAARAMVLDSPFISLEAMAEDHYRFLIGPLKRPFIWASKLYARVFMKRSIADASALREVGQVTCPVLFIHGAQDDMIPAWHSKRLYDACPSLRKEYWLIEGAGHGKTMVHNAREYQERVTRFFLDAFATEEK